MREPQYIGIVGSRRRAIANDFVLLLAAFDRVYRPVDWIVSGGCYKGADEFAERIAESRGIPMVVYPADWNGPLGKRAGFARNTTIAQQADVLLALVAPDRTGGTEDTVRKALSFGKRVWLVEGPDSLVFQEVG